MVRLTRLTPTRPLSGTGGRTDTLEGGVGECGGRGSACAYCYTVVSSAILLSIKMHSGVCLFLLSFLLLSFFFFKSGSVLLDRLFLHSVCFCLARHIISSLCLFLVFWTSYHFIQHVSGLLDKLFLHSLGFCSSRPVISSFYLFLISTGLLFSSSFSICS